MIIYFIFEKIVNTILVMKKIVGLDLGTNSIGWALINAYIDEYLSLIHISEPTRP